MSVGADPSAAYEEYLRSKLGASDAPEVDLGVTRNQPDEGAYAEFQQFKTSTAPATASDPSVMGEITGVFSQVNQGIAEGLGAPIDLVNAALGGVGGGAPVGGSAMAKRAMPAEVQPQTATGRVVGRIGREVAANVTGVLTGTKLIGALSSMPGRIGEFSKRLAALDRAALAKIEARISLWTGSGAAAAGELGRAQRASPESRRWLDFAGQLVGALGGAGARGLLGFFKSRGATGSEVAVGKGLAEAIPEGSMQERNLSESRALREVVPEVPATTAQATGSAVLGAETARASQVAGRGTQLQQQPAQASAAIQSRIAAVAPTGEVTAAQRAVREVGAGLDAQMTEHVENARREVDATLRQLGNPRDRVAASEAILGAIVREDLKVKTAAGKLFDAVPATGTTLDATALNGTVKAAINEASIGLRPGAIPPAISTLAGKIEGRSSVSFGEVRRWRSDLLDELRDEAGSANPNRQKLRLLNGVLDSVETTLGQAGESNEAYRTAAAAYKDYVTRFRQGVVSKVTQKGPRGEPNRQAVETVAAEFFNSGAAAPTRSRAFTAAVGGDAAANAALRDYAVGNFLDVTAPGTKGATQRAAKWLTKHREALDDRPGVRAEVQRVVAAMRGADTVEKATERVKAMVARGQIPMSQNLAALATRTREATEVAVVREFIGADPSEAIGAVLTRSDRVQQTQKLVTMVGRDPVAMDGLRHGFIEHMQRAIVDEHADAVGKSPLLEPDAMRKFLSQHDGVVRELFPGVVGDRLRLLQRTAEVVLFPNRVNATPNLLDGTTQAGLYTMNGLISRAYGLERGVVGRSYAVTELMVRGVQRALDSIGQAHIRRVMDRALFDPEAAEQLLMLGRRVMANERAAISGFEAYALGLGPTAARQVAPRERER